VFCFDKLPIRSTQKRLEVWQDVKSVPYIKIENVTKIYGDIRTISDVSLDVYKGEFFSILGKSGCGKTTLLRMLAGFERPTNGKISIDGADITKTPSYERPVNMMFQSYALFPHMDVYRNISFGLKCDKLPRNEVENRVSVVLALVQLEGFENRYPEQLSGGQKQRVALARSLVKRPKLLLLDEPLTALDKNLREQTQFELVNIQEKVGITFIVVTHDQEEAMTMSTRIAVMDGGQIKQIGAPRDVYEFPNCKFVAEFIGNINFFNGFIVSEDLDQVTIESADIETPIHSVHTGAIPIGSSVTFAIRPEKMKISVEHPCSPRNCTKGVVKEIAYLGDFSIYHVRTHKTQRNIKVVQLNPSRFSVTNITWEDEVYIFWKEEDVIVLNS
jgi:putrescine transport system ATP-binding protein